MAEPEAVQGLTAAWYALLQNKSHIMQLENADVQTDDVLSISERVCESKEITAAN